jgi:tight adherence protein B
MSAWLAAAAVAVVVLLRGLRSAPRARLLDQVSVVRTRPDASVGPRPVIAVALLVGFLLGAPVPLLVAAVVAAVAGPLGMRRRRHRQVVARRTSETVEMVFALAAEVRAGRPPGRALALVAATASELRFPLHQASRAVEAGASAASELGSLAVMPGCSGLLGVAAAWQVTEAAGGPVADVLDRLGEVLDADAQSRAALAAALAAPRATVALLAALPVLGVALGESLGAHPLDLLMHQPIGWALVCAAAVLDCIGIGWMQLLVRRALR